MPGRGVRARGAFRRVLRRKRDDGAPVLSLEREPRDELPAGDLTGYEFRGRVRLAGPDAVIAVPAGDGVEPASLTAPTGTVEDRPRTPDEGGDPPPAGTWPAGDEGPRPQL